MKNKFLTLTVLAATVASLSACGTGLSREARVNQPARAYVSLPNQPRTDREQNLDNNAPRQFSRVTKPNALSQIETAAGGNFGDVSAKPRVNPFSDIETAAGGNVNPFAGQQQFQAPVAAVAPSRRIISRTTTTYPTQPVSQQPEYNSNNMLLPNMQPVR